MRKHVQYEVNASISFDGEIQEASCECTVGHSKTAHCKHVTVLLLAMNDVCLNRTVILEQTSTEKLQTFHQPTKKYTGSPMKAKLFQQRTPMPEYNLDNKDYAIWYQNYCRNLFIARGYNNSMSIKMMLEPANPYAIEWDHCYSTYNAKNALLKSLYLLDVSEEQVQEIEQETRGQSNNKAWHEKRCHRITASNFYACCNEKLSKKGAETVVQLILNPRPFTSKATSHGKIYEDVAVNLFNESRHNELNIQECGLFILPSHPYIGGSPDRLLALLSVIEVKCPYASRNLPINEINVPYLERDENNCLTLRKNHSYYYQIQGQLLVTGRLYCDLLIYTFKELVQISIEKDDKFTSEMLFKLTNFYETYLKPAIFEKYIYRNYDKLF